MSPSPNDSRRAWIASAAIVLLTLVLYAPVRHHAFVSIDTARYVTGNPRVLAGPSWPGFAWACTSFEAANWHPLTWLSHMLDVQLFGLDPAGHHLVNVAFHAANSVLVFLVLRRATERFGASLAVAQLFAVHPLHVESVAWIVERKDVLSAFFGLLSLHAWTSFARGGSRGAYAVALVCFALALMSKPMLVTMPCALLVFDAWPLRRTGLGFARLLLEKLPFFALAFASCWVTIAAQASGGAIQGMRELSVAARLENAVASVGWYASRTAWPSGLSFHYPLARGGAGTAAFVTGALVLVGASAIALASLRQRPWIAAGWAWFLGTLVPVLGFVQVGGQAHADRYAYLPILGLFVALVWTADAWIVGAGAKRALTVAFCLAFGMLARQRIGAWQDSATLARRALQVDGGNAVAHDVLGWALVASGDGEAGVEHLRTAIALEPGDPDAHRNLGLALLGRGHVKEAEQELRTAVASRPEDPRFLLELGSLLVLRGALDEARAVLAHARDRAPDDPLVHVALGELWQKRGDLAGAEREFETALALDPANVRANVDLAGILIAREDFADAERRLAAALSTDPASPQALQQRALVLVVRGESARAARDLRAALRARPDWPLAMSDLAWILATATDPLVRAPAEALDLASRAVELCQARRAEFLDALALSLAANGRFDEAARCAESAANLAREEGDSRLAATIARRLAAYRGRTLDLSIPRREPEPR